MAKLYFRYGAMGSSKTANAIMVRYNYRERGQNALMLKPCLDNRDGERIVGSRSGLSAPCLYVEELDNVDLDKYNCIIVDEAQFLTKAQVEKLTDIADEKDIPVICYGLRADFRGELFEGSTWLMAWADTIEEIKTVCWCGKKATYNARVINGKVAREGEQIVLGGNESYVALCRKHWKKGELAPKEIRKLTSDIAPVLADFGRGSVRYGENAEMYVLSVRGNIVAEAIVENESERVSRLDDLAVKQAFRGLGYGKELVEHLLYVYGAQYTVMSAEAPKDVADFFIHTGFKVVSQNEDSVRLDAKL